MREVPRGLPVQRAEPVDHGSQRAGPSMPEPGERGAGGQIWARGHVAERYQFAGRLASDTW